MRVAVLALQGAFLEHEKVLQSLGTETLELRSPKDLEHSFDALVLPGGESTVQGKFLHETGMLEPLQEKIRAGLPTFATCAGLILLASEISNDDRRAFATLPVTVRRNGYGRQLGSFRTTGTVTYPDRTLEDVPFEFIRAPYIESAGAGVEILAEVDGRIVGVRYKNQTAYAFHPELTEDPRLHEQFLRSV